MSESSEEITIEHVLVALDASAHGLAALDAAARIAAELRAELRGLFVEDADLLRLPGLPFVREVAYASAVQRQLSLSAIERTLRAKAEQVRQALATSAGRARVQWRFEVTRGQLAKATLAAAQQADLVIVGRAPKPSLAPSRIAREAKQRPIIVVYEGTASGLRALSTAAQLASDHAGQILILVAAPDEAQAGPLRKQALAWLEQRGLAAKAAQSHVTSGLHLAQVARRFRGSVLLLGRDSKLLDEATFEVLAGDLDYPVGLVR